MVRFRTVPVAGCCAPPRPAPPRLGGVLLSALLILAVPCVPLQLYANYLGQHLRYQHSVSPGPAHGAHAYQPAGQQMLLHGAMMLPGVAPMTPMTSVMGYGHVPQFPMQVPMQSMHGYGSPLLGLQGYTSYPGWAQGLGQGLAQGVNTHGVAAAAAPRGSSYAAAASAGLPVLRGQLPGMPGAGAFPAMATAAPVFFPQLLSGLPTVIPR